MRICHRTLRPSAGSARHRGGFVLLASIFLTAFLVVFLATAALRNRSTMEETAGRIDTQQAFYAAESGVDRVIFELRREAAWRSPAGMPGQVVDAPLNLDDGTRIGFYTIETVDAADYSGWPSVWVRSIGEDATQTAVRIVVARVIVENPAAFIVSTMGDLTVTSGADIQADILGRDVIFDQTDPVIKPRVDGVVYYLRDLINPDQADLAETPVEMPSMSLAGVDLERYRAIAQNVGEYYSDPGTTTIDLGGVAPEVPIIFAEGNIRISGRFDHPVLVVAAKDIQIRGSVTSRSLDPNQAAPQIGLLAKQNVVIPTSAPRDMDIEAFVMADGDNGSGGKFYAEGSYGSKGSLNFLGSMAVRGDTDETAVNLNAFSDRDYVYNTELSTNRNIPFLPFIANLIPGSWREASLQDAFPPS